MLTLALETSGFGGSLALLDGTELLGERILDSTRRHAQTLVPEIQDLLRRCGRRAIDCQVLAVSCGPGSFTGLRVGLTCVKTMAYATGARIAPVPTFLGIVAACPSDVATIQVVLNAQREEFFIGSYSRGLTGKWVESQPLRMERVDKWLNELKLDDVVTGPGVEPIVAEVSRRCRVLSTNFWQPRAAWIGRVGHEFAENGQLISCWELEPYYVRKSAAEEKWDAKTATA